MEWFKNLLNKIFRIKTPKPIPTPEPVEPTPIPEPEPIPVPEPEPKLPTVAENLLKLHNDYRTANRKSLLQIDERLVEAALKHAVWMDKNLRDPYGRDLTHIGNRQSQPRDRTTAEGYPNAAIGENIAMGAISNESVFNMWVKSRGHQDNILGNYKNFGAAKFGNYWCVVFGG